jgi:putative membrane protein
MTGPVLPTLLWRHWQPTWGVDIEAALVASLYLLGVRRLRAPWPKRRTAAFLGGVACVVVALGSGIGAFDDRMLSDHMVQHVILLELAPLLALAGRPGLLVLRSAPRAGRPAVADGFARLRPLTHPLGCLTIFSVVVLATHLPAFYEATLRSPVLHQLEHGLYLVAGMLMWWPVLDADPMPRRRLDGFARLVYVIAAMLPMTLLGAYLDRAPGLVYAGYGPPARTLGISAIVDQQQAGAIMWVLGSTLMIAAGLWQAMAAMADEERRLQVRERRADAIVITDSGREP